MSDFVKGFVSAELATVSISFNKDYVPVKGPNAGKSQGPVLFLNAGKRSVQEFDTATEALESAIGEVPEKTKVYADGKYLSLEDAVELDLMPYQYQYDENRPPKWQLSFFSTKGVKRKNKDLASGVRAKQPKQAAPAKANKDRPLF